MISSCQQLFVKNKILGRLKWIKTNDSLKRGRKNMNAVTINWDEYSCYLQSTNFLLFMTAKGEAVQKRVKDPVAEMKIFREGCKKENMNKKIFEEFKINSPANINIYSEKPNNNSFILEKYKKQGRTINGVDWNQQTDERVMKTVLTEEIGNKLKTVSQVPKQKYDFPQTSSQQLGWYLDKMKENSSFGHKRTGCEETHYADNFFTMRHTSLFSNKN